MLHRLMGGAILAKTDGIMGHHVDHPETHQRRQPERRAKIVGKHHERAAIGNEPMMQRQAVHDGRHGVFAYPVMQIPATGVVRGNRTGGLGQGQVGMGEVGRTAGQLRDGGGQHLQRLLGRLAGRPGRTVGQHLGLEGGGGGLPVGRQKSDDGPVEGLALGAAQGCQAPFPGQPRRFAAPAGGAPRLQNRRRDDEGFVGPVQPRPCPGDLLGTQGRAVTFLGPGAGRRTETDHGAAGDQRRPLGRHRGLHGGGDGLGIVAVDRHRVPAAGLKARQLVVADRKIRRAVDADAVVVPQHRQLFQAVMASQRDRFLAEAFHQAAVAGQDPGPMIHQIAAETRRQHFLGQGEADRVRQPLPQRTGGGFGDADMAVFGMSGGPGAQLAEGLDLFNVDVVIAGKIGQRIEQHGAVSGRQNKPVAVRPMGRLGVKGQKAGEQHRRQIGGPHRHTGVAGLCLFHGIGGQKADGVGHLSCSHRKLPFSLECKLSPGRMRRTGKVPQGLTLPSRKIFQCQ